MPNEVCSKCHEDFMNCKCETFHPNIIMYKCPLCGLKFNIEKEKNLHILLRHRVVNDERR